MRARMVRPYTRTRFEAHALVGMRTHAQGPQVMGPGSSQAKAEAVNKNETLPVPV